MLMERLAHFSTLEVLARLCKEASPISASGGWFSTEVIEKHASVSRSVINDHLILLENAGLAEKRRKKLKGSTAGNGTRWEWRVR